MLDSLFAWLDSMGTATHHPYVLMVLALGAFSEYVVPIVPGDTVSLLGGILCGAYGWSLPLVFSMLMLGSLAGSYLAFYLGRFWQRRRERKGYSIESQSSRLNRVLLGFRRHGAWFLVINRFFPGVRALFFVAAGMVGIPVGRVLLFSGLSAALWNALILAAGYSVGDNLPKLRAWLSTYSTVAWSVVIAFVLAFALKLAWTSLRARQD